MTTQEMIEKYKQEAIQSQTVTGNNIPWIGMYQAQNEEHRDYGDQNSALAAEEQNRAFLEQLSNATQAINNQAQALNDVANAKAAVEEAVMQKGSYNPNVFNLMQDSLGINSDIGLNGMPKYLTVENSQVGSGIKQLDSLADYKSQLPQTEPTGVMKYLEDHPEEIDYVSRYMNEHNQVMDGLDYQKFLEQQKDVAQARAFLNPNYKMNKSEEKWAEKMSEDRIKVLKSKGNLSPEEKEELEVWKALGDKADEATSFIMGATNEAVKMERGLNGIVKNIGTPELKLIDKLSQPVRDKFNETWDAPEAQKFIQNQAVQNPIANAGGNFATQALMYSLTNPVFDSLAETAGLKGLSAWGANQGAQLGQDVLLDLIPSYEEMAKDGKVTKDEWKELAKQTGWNAAGNLVMGIPSLGKEIKALAKNNAAIKEVDDLVKGATNQAETAAKNIENLAKENEKVLPDLGDMTKGAEVKSYDIEPEIPKIAENTQKVASKPSKLELPEDVIEKGSSDFEEIYNALENSYKKAKSLNDPEIMTKYEKMGKAVRDYEDAFYKNASNEELVKAKNAADAARQGFYRAVKKVDPSYKGDLTGTKLGNAAYRRTSMLGDTKANQELADEILKTESDNIKTFGDNTHVKDAVPETQKVFRSPTEKVEGANPLQTFGGDSGGRWETSKARTNTFENQGWGNALPQKDYAYKVYSEAEQNADALARGEGFKDLIYKDSFDEVDVKQAMNEIQSLMDSGDTQSANRLAKKLAFEGREGGRKVQAFAEYNRNSAVGAITDATKMQDDSIIQPWITQNKKQAEGNSRIARALADMGNKWKGGKEVRNLTHDEIRKGVIAELEREVGSVEKYFNENDIEFLTTLAEDKSIPVWKITSEIEHKLNTGNWYTLDESLPIPQPTNKKLQSALNSLITDEVRATEKAAPSLKDINKEVRNTLSKEFADFEGQFSENDIDYLANLIGNGATKQEITDALNTKLATGSFGISDETLQEVNNIFKQISNYDPNSKQFVEGQLEAYRLLANEVVGDATPMEKFEAWRYLAMLGNPKTMIRNFVGNQTFGAVTGISNNIAALAEAGVDKTVKALGGEGIQRTKSVLNPLTDVDLIKASAVDADASRYRQIIGSKYEKMDANTLRQSKSVFKTKLAQLYEKATDAGISDYKAVKNKYSTSLAGYLKANGYGTDIFKAEENLARLKNLQETQLLSSAERKQMEDLTKEVAELNKARDYALKQAEYATFHEDNDLAKLLTETSRKARNSDNLGARMLGTVIEGTVPFKKTPANILRSGIEYSPLGAIDSIKKTGKLVYENTGKRAGNLADTYVKKGLLSGKEKEVTKTLAADVIDSWSKTLTGTGLTALGFYLYNKGVLHSSDPDTQYQDQLEGHQNYAIEINGKSYTIDWASPSIMPLMVGAEVAKLWDSTGKDTEEFYSNIDKYIAAANRIADPIVETSMLQGVKDTLETAANAAKYDENLNIPALLMYNSATGYLSQGVPTAAGQIARTVDPTRRSTYTDKEGVAGVIDKQIKKQMNKIPGLSTLNEPYVNTYGEEQQNSPFDNPLANFAYQSLSPGYLTSINERGADKVSREAYENSGDTKALPSLKASPKIDGERVSDSDNTTFRKASGQTELDIRDSLSKDEWFNSLDQGEKDEIINDVNGIAEKMGYAAINPEYANESKPYLAYKEGGMDGLLDYYKNQHDKAELKEMSGGNIKPNSNVGKEALDLLGQGKTEKAQEVINDGLAEKEAKAAKKEETQAAQDDLSIYGLTKTSAAKTYEKAQTVIPGLTSQQFASTYKMIDSDGNQGIRQDEIIDYLNKYVTSDNKGQEIWSAYGNSTWKSIPVLENGTWKKKKK